jgi:hypothetical protein
MHPASGTAMPHPRPCSRKPRGLSLASEKAHADALPGWDKTILPRPHAEIEIPFQFNHLRHFTELARGLR